MILTILALIFAVLFGYSLTHLPIPILQIQWQIWGALALASAIGLILCLIFSRPKKQRSDEEMKAAMKGHLKISILFWSYYYKKEKVKTLEEAKREVFQDLRKEFSQLPWMESMIEEIRQELSKYK
ncbi:MAG: hypothetical protein K1X28_08180 [Parachlamydiales bacterium]|nr:hypothetical protein [Parachlamydiales bacterium]